MSVYWVSHCSVLGREGRSNTAKTALIWADRDENEDALLVRAERNSFKLHVTQLWLIGTHGKILALPSDV